MTIVLVLLSIVATMACLYLAYMMIILMIFATKNHHGEKDVIFIGGYCLMIAILLFSNYMMVHGLSMMWTYALQ